MMLRPHQYVPLFVRGIDTVTSNGHLSKKIQGRVLITPRTCERPRAAQRKRGYFNTLRAGCAPLSAAVSMSARERKSCRASDGSAEACGAHSRLESAFAFEDVHVAPLCAAAQAMGQCIHAKFHQCITDMGSRHDAAWNCRSPADSACND